MKIAAVLLTLLCSMNALAAHETVTIPGFSVQLPVSTPHLGYDRIDDTTGRCFLYVSENPLFKNAPLRLEIMEKDLLDPRFVTATDALHVGVKNNELVVSSPRVCGEAGGLRVSVSVNENKTKTATIRCTKVGLTTNVRSVVTITVDETNTLVALSVKNIGHVWNRPLKSDLSCQF